MATAPPVYRPVQPTAVQRVRDGGFFSPAMPRVPAVVAPHQASSRAFAGPVPAPFFAVSVLQCNRKKRKAGNQGGKKKKKRRLYSDYGNDSDGDDADDEYSPTAVAASRPAFRSGVAATVVKETAHQRVNVNSKYKKIYTCPRCGRPLAYKKAGTSTLHFTPFEYTSRNGNAKTQRALELDHHPTWASRYTTLKANGASKEEIKDAYNDTDQLRALCRKCNGSHKYEGKNVADYDSDQDESGYETPDDEPDNAGNYSPFRFPPPGGSGASGGIVA